MNVSKGQMVRLHPATDLFMRGVVWAEVVSIGPKWITIHHATTNTKHRVPKAQAEKFFFNKNDF